MSRPQTPFILPEFKDKLWFLAILIDTGGNSPKKLEQQSARPQGPKPP